MVIRKRKENYMGEIVDYIEKNMKKGYTRESLKWALIQQGYSKLEVEKAIQQINKKLAEKAPPLEVKPQITYQASPVVQVEEEKPWWKRLFGKE